MTNAEITAWKLGCQLRLEGVAVISFLAKPQRTISMLITKEEQKAQARLGDADFAYWVRRGYDDAVAESRS